MSAAVLMNFAVVPGESVLFYTDRLIETHNPKGEGWEGPKRHPDGGVGALHWRGGNRRMT